MCVRSPDGGEFGVHPGGAEDDRVQGEGGGVDGGAQATHDALRQGQVAVPRG